MAFNEENEREMAPDEFDMEAALAELAVLIGDDFHIGPYVAPSKPDAGSEFEPDADAGME